MAPRSFAAWNSGRGSGLIQRERTAAVVVVGDELLAGAHPDLNSPVIARELARVGIDSCEFRVVGDDTAQIAHAVSELANEHGLILVSGGLGPTLDDVTRDGIAAAMGVELIESERARNDLEAWWQDSNVPMSATNLRQALFPAGCELVLNRVGTAHGFRGQLDSLRVAGRAPWVISLPGPPRELGVVLTEEVVPWLVATGLATEPLAEYRFHLFGLSESKFAEECGAWMERGTDPRIGCSAKEGGLHIVLRAGSVAESSLQRLLDRTDRFRERFGEHIFSEGAEGRIQCVFGQALIDAGLKVSLAESCTAGLATALLAEVAGISAALERSWVTYANEAKVELGVDPGLIEAHGAVSVEVAADMARAAAQVGGADIGIGITGIAGPDGGTPEKPVGLVCFGTYFQGETRTFSRTLPPADRTWIRSVAARTALYHAWRRLQDDGSGFR